MSHLVVGWLYIRLGEVLNSSAKLGLSIHRHHGLLQIVIFASSTVSRKKMVSVLGL